MSWLTNRTFSQDSLLPTHRHASSSALQRSTRASTTAYSPLFETVVSQGKFNEWIGTGL